MKALSESEFREYKKIIIGTTHEMETVLEKFNNIMKMKEKFMENGIELNEKQLNELEEYEDRFSKCLSDFKGY